jgi:hypothetical protein
MDLYLKKNTDLRLQLLVMTFIILLYALRPASALYGFTIDTYYPLLAEGFFHGHLYLPTLPSSQLLHLSNPYDPLQNACCRQMFDASLYNGKYYLYFGPLPLIFFFFFKLLTGKIATEATTVFFFLSVGFTANFYLLIKIREKYFPHITSAELMFSGALMGIASNALFLLGRPSVYETALAATFCSMSLALFFLYNVYTNNFKIRDLILFSFCLSLCVAGRAHFVLVCTLMVPGVFIYLLKNAPRKCLLNLSLALFVPIVFVGTLLALYNYFRFDSIWEFGQHYQIADSNKMLDRSFNVDYHNWIAGLYFYFISNFTILTPPKFHEFAKYYMAIHLDGAIAILGYVKGALRIAPVIVFVLALPLALRSTVKNSHSQIRPLLWFCLFTLLVPVIITWYLISIPAINQRYETDFLPYLILLAIISAWLFDRSHFSSLTKKIIRLMFIVTGLASIILAFTV